MMRFVPCWPGPVDWVAVIWPKVLLLRVAGGSGKVGVINHVESFRTRLQPPSFGDGEDPAERRIELERSGGKSSVVRNIAEGTGRVWHEGRAFRYWGRPAPQLEL